MARADVSNGKVKTPTANDLADQIATLKTDLADLTSLIGDMGAAQGAQAKEKMQERVEAARDAGAAHIDDAKVQAQKLGAEANDFITRQPATALGIAAGIGFLVGMLGARK